MNSLLKASKIDHMSTRGWELTQLNGVIRFERRYRYDFGFFTSILCGDQKHFSLAAWNRSSVYSYELWTATKYPVYFCTLENCIPLLYFLYAIFLLGVNFGQLKLWRPNLFRFPLRLAIYQHHRRATFSRSRITEGAIFLLEYTVQRDRRHWYLLDLHEQTYFWIQSDRTIIIVSRKGTGTK